MNVYQASPNLSVGLFEVETAYLTTQTVVCQALFSFLRVAFVNCQLNLECFAFISLGRLSYGVVS
jgi:hypothetical protein